MRILRSASIFVFVFFCVTQLSAATFTNPIISNGADPWITSKDGFFYYTHTSGSNLRVRKAATLTGNTGLANAAAPIVFTAPAPYNRSVWAPELHFLQNKWYLYFAADDGDNANHRMYVAESDTADPQGTYTFKGKISDASNRWAIDGTVLEMEDGSLYFVWSGWPGFTDGLQNLYIAPMSDPWTISGPRVLISTPTHTWESWINEGPQILKRNGKIFIIYSANRSWTDEYCFGLLMNTDGNVLNPSSWAKYPIPVFKQYSGPDGSVFGPGHGSFTKSIDQKEDWLIYHAAKSSGSGWDRNVRLQKFTWGANDLPIFGTPVPAGIFIDVPSGEEANILNVTWNSGGFVTRSPNQHSFPQNATATLTAVPAFGSFFAGWKGDVTGSENPLTVTMDKNKLISAVFTNQLVLDNSQASFGGIWSTGMTASTRFGADYRFAHASNTSTHTATYVPDIPATAKYDIYVWYPGGSNRTTAAPHLISDFHGTNTVTVNQQTNGGSWRLLAAGRRFVQGTNGFIQIGNKSDESNKVVMADAVRLVFSSNQDLPPVITSHPVDVQIPRGSNAAFSGSVTGTPPFHYQWRFNGTNLAGATTNVLLRSNVQGIDSGIYSLLVSNHEGIAISSNAILAVQIPLEMNRAMLGSNRELNLLIKGTYGSTNTLVASTNLVEWFVVTNFVMKSSEVEISDVATNSPQRFYRLTESE